MKALVITGIILLTLLTLSNIIMAIYDTLHEVNGVSDSGYYLVRAEDYTEDVEFRSRKLAIKFAKRFHGIVVDLDNELVIANYEIGR